MKKSSPFQWEVTTQKIGGKIERQSSRHKTEEAAMKEADRLRLWFRVPVVVRVKKIVRITRVV